MFLFLNKIFVRSLLFHSVFHHICCYFFRIFFNFFFILYLNVFLFVIFIPLFVNFGFLKQDLHNEYFLDFYYINPFLILFYIYLPFCFFLYRISYLYCYGCIFKAVFNFKSHLIFFCFTFTILLEMFYTFLFNKHYFLLYNEILLLFSLFFTYLIFFFIYLFFSDLSYLISFLKNSKLFVFLYIPLITFLNSFFIFLLCNLVSFLFLIPISLMFYFLIYLYFFKNNFVEIKLFSVFLEVLILVKEKLDAFFLFFYFDDSGNFFKSFIIYWLNLDYRLFCLLFGYLLTVFSILYLFIAIVSVLVTYAFLNNQNLQNQLVKKDDYSKKINNKYIDLVLKKKKMSSSMFNYILLKKKVPLEDVESYYDNHLNKQKAYKQKGLKLKL